MPQKCYTQSVQREDWLLLALHYAQEHGLSPVQIQKSLFLLGAEMRREVGPDFYDFIPHNYGPFSREIYVDAKQLAERGLLTIEPRKTYSQYIITDGGRHRVRDIENEFSPRASAYLSQVVGWTRRQSFSALVRAIYAKYPDYRRNSVFQY